MKKTIVERLKKVVVVLMAANMLLTFSNAGSMNCEEYGIMPCGEELEEAMDEYF